VHREEFNSALDALQSALREYRTQQCRYEAAQGGLTKRETDILTRIAGGATNKQVAEQIFISEKTVGRHLANIYTKLGVSSRTAAVTWAYTHNVLRSPD
jgi:DNA-binding NarL/FixJ family response regulator